jgi:hypothetical protein
MDTINIKIVFHDNAKPYIAFDEYANTYLSLPAGALPNIGDTIQLDGITHPKGSFVVVHREFSLPNGCLDVVALTLSTEF